jgi:hypothetical protein
MSKHEKKQKLAEPWRAIHAAIWLVGLYILFSQGSFWPGILVLLALSGIVEALIKKYVPGSSEDEDEAESPAKTPPPVTQVPQAAPEPPATALEHRLELLPSICPKCGGPIRGHDVKWTGPQSADCPFCGANLPMVK